MLHEINAENLIDMDSEIHYSFRNFIPKKEYPQRHDFYEFFLVTSGAFQFVADGRQRIVRQDDFCMLTPGTIHAKYEIPESPSSHINLAFLSSTMDDLCRYLYGRCPDEVLPCGAELLSLAKHESSMLRSEMEFISLMPDACQEEKRTYMRQLLVYIVFQILAPQKKADKETTLIIPRWLQETMQCFSRVDSLAQGLPGIIHMTGLSKEYVCRSFKKYLGLTPTQYVNMKRLDYVANMLVHSDRSIQELCYAMGFSSMSYFYKIFFKAFGMTPAAYKKRKTMPAT